LTLGGDFVRQGNQIRNLENPADREPKRLHAAGGAARAALVQPWKRGSVAVLARLRQRF